MKNRTDREKFARAVSMQRAEQLAEKLEKQPFQPERLKQARELRGLSKGELVIACRVIIGRTLPIGSYENETRAPDANEIRCFARALKMPIHFFTQPPSKDGFIGLDRSNWNTLESHLALGCPCGMDNCGYWAIGDMVIEPCRFGGKAPSCEWCERKATQLCDGQARYDREPNGETCDRRLCTHHRKRIGPRADVCPECAKKAQFVS